MTTSKLDILLKCITLLYREKELGEAGGDNSKGIVKTIIGLQKEAFNKNLIGGENQLLEDIKKILSGMLVDSESIEKTSLLDSLRLALRDKTTTYQAIEKTLTTDLSLGSIKRNTISLRQQLDLYFKEQQAMILLTKATFSMRQGLEDVSLQDFLTQLSTNLEALTTPIKAKDPGIVEEMDIGNEEEVGAVMGKVKKVSQSDGLILTGFKELNNMFMGGFRKGECLMYEALQHNYKSGIAQSLSAQIPIYNKPEKLLKDHTKKPLLLFVSLEDDPEIIIGFIYSFLYNNENNCEPDLSSVSKEEMAKYVKEKISINGWHVKYFRVNPSEWSYKHLFNLVLKLEAMGYEILTCIIDYLAKLPTTGCVNMGSTGSDLHDLFNRFRNFFSAREIFSVTPHQLSTEAKQLLRQNVVSDVNFVKEIAGKGYSEISRRLDQVIDCEFYIHKAYVNRKPFLTFGWGKHRRTGVVDDKYKYFMLPFPKNAPIRDTINTPDEGSESGTGSNDDFDI